MAAYLASWKSGDVVQVVDKKGVAHAALWNAQTRKATNLHCGKKSGYTVSVISFERAVNRCPDCVYMEQPIGG